MVHDIDEKQTIKALGRGLLKDGGELEAFWRDKELEIVD